MKRRNIPALSDTASLHSASLSAACTNNLVCLFVFSFAQTQFPSTASVRVADDREMPRGAEWACSF